MAAVFASFGAPAASRAAPLRLQSGFVSCCTHRRSLVVDTDMAFDDIFALLLLTRASGRSMYDLELISTVTGISCASFGATAARALFPSTVVMAGKNRKDCRSRSKHSWLPAYRERFRLFASRSISENLFCGANADNDDETCSGSVDALIETLSASDDSGCDLMCLGPLTNVATWLDDPDLSELMKQKLGQVWILGGNLPGISSEGEFNFLEDTHAASKVIESPYLAGKLRIVTSCVSGSESRDFSSGIVNSVSAALSASGNNDEKMKEILQVEPKALFYDPVCAFAYTHGDSLPLETTKVRVAANGVLEFDAKAQSSVKLLRHMNKAHQQKYVEWIQSCSKSTLLLE